MVNVYCFVGYIYITMVNKSIIYYIEENFSVVNISLYSSFGYIYILISIHISIHISNLI
jgi:hypothetical protein